MRIEVDTKHDSKEDIKKVIKMLTHLIEDTATFGAYEASTGVSESQSSSPSYDSFPGLGFMEGSSSGSSSTSSSTGSSSQVEIQMKEEQKEESFDFTDLETF